MADENGAKADSLTKRLRDEPYELDFYQAVRRIECARPDRPRIACSQLPHEDPVQFCQNVSMAFAPSAIAAYEEATDGRPPRLSVNFFGLLGPNGPMPLHITAHTRNRIRNHGDNTLAGFLDIFNHRMISLFYRAWACNQQNVSYDRQEDDRFKAYIGSMFGIGDDSWRNRDAVADVAKLHYSGRLVCPNRNAEGLQATLQDYFGIEVDIEQFVGQWMNLPDEYRCRMAESPETGRLGATIVVGSRFWECQQKFGLRFGPMNFSDYQRMLPGGDSLGRLIAWVKNYTADELSWELQLVLKAEDVPETRLGTLGRLGLSTWLKSKRFTTDADDLILRNLSV
ncbi:MAG TPA: type VI secretion system baseplate subunit TssG [Planctomycetes bacterium]|nr:type VI secretion system baseplate subunit TssG [Planctomycetota bacterium]